MKCRLLTIRPCYVKGSVLVLSLLFFRSLCLGQFMTCDAPSGTAYFIFVDDIRPSSTSLTKAEQRAIDTYSTGLANNLDDIATLTRSTVVRVDCTGRYPTLGDFKRASVEQLNDRNVVMELWGTVRETGNQLQAELVLTLVPARLEELSEQPPLQGFYRLKYELSTTFLFDLFRRSPDLKGYALISAGMRAAKQHDYDQANYFFCNGEDALKESLKAKPSAEGRALLIYAQSVSSGLVDQARREHKGRLQLLQPGQENLRCRGTQ